MKGGISSGRAAYSEYVGSCVNIMLLRGILSAASSSAEPHSQRPQVQILFPGYFISGGSKNKLFSSSGHSRFGKIREARDGTFLVISFCCCKLFSIMTTFVLPGDKILPEAFPLPSNPSAALKLGPGLRYVPPSTITPVLAGPLRVDHKKNAMWVENSNERVRWSCSFSARTSCEPLTQPQYMPQANDVVLAIVHHSATDYYSCSITPHTAFALLPQLSFEGATKKTRPQLSAGSLIYARIASASKHMEPELICYNPSTGKSEGMGELIGGTVVKISLGLCRRLLMSRQREDGGVVVLEEIAARVAFEVAVGRNGLVWIKAGTVKEILIVRKALQETDGGGLMIAEQEKLV